MIQVLRLEPNAPKGEPPELLLFLDSSRKLGLESFLAQHHNNENKRKINDRSGKQLSRCNIRLAKGKARRVVKKNRSEEKSPARINEARSASNRRDQANWDKDQ